MNQEINNQSSVFAYSAAKKSNPTLLPPVTAPAVRSGVSVFACSASKKSSPCSAVMKPIPTFLPPAETHNPELIAI